ncbi:MAG: M20/M25/M40 family metallo-hydrolase [Chryseobacterium sp.]|nr:M20/M25/M40 family metallo-hydrolase [Chryseobacterium sp.]
MKLNYFFVALLLNCFIAQAQQKSSNDASVIASLKKNINYLADDKLEGRRTGTAGEKLAYEFIQTQFKKAGLKGFTADKQYVQDFEVNEGREIGKSTSFIIGDIAYSETEHFFPFAFSGNLAPTKLESIKKDITFFDLADLLKENQNNPHFDLKEKILNVCNDQISKNKKLIIFTNTGSIKDDLKFDERDKTPVLSIPVIYVKERLRSNLSGGLSAVTLSISVTAKTKIGHNVIGYINNKATNTIILGAHYDHLGYGEDHNSLYNGSTPMIHNGADDNASGTAALIELAKKLKKSSYKKYNYLFVSFSGEELGLFGSKYFTDHAGLDLKTVNYMINMDMVGRLNDSTHGLTIGGYGTSPTWGKIINTKDAYFKINADSSGSGPSDHTSFYKKDIPVLFFFTGSHKDYHKPTDDADKINYEGELQIIKYIENIIAQTNGMDKLAFTKTREVSMGKSSFKVSMGIMPDYTFSGNGVLVDGVSENRPAIKAGIKTGDVLMQLGEHKFSDVQTYMDALNKFNKGESTKVKLMRGKELLEFMVTF